MITLAAHDINGDGVEVTTAGHLVTIYCAGNGIDLPPAEAVRLAGALALAAVEAMDAERVG